MACLFMVDDELYNPHMMEEFLGRGHQFVTAANGLRAWQLLDLEPVRAFDSHARGIAIAHQMAFASLDYQSAGNAVTATVQIQGNTQ